MTTLEILKKAKAAVTELSVLSTFQKNNALLSMANHLEIEIPEIIEANKSDVEAAKVSISDVMIDRLTLTPERIKGMADGIREVAELPDPVGEVIDSFSRPNGLQIEKIRVPMGVVAIIYESRPNVTSDAAVLAFKSGNVAVLRGGKEAYGSSFAILHALKSGLRAVGLSEDFVNMLEDTTREGARELMTATDYVDLLIPRGGAGLIRSCIENARVPCIQTGTGICHIYVDETADLDKALDIIENAKTSRPSVCNAAEVCIVNRKIVDKFLPMLKKRLTDDRKAKRMTEVELRCDDEAFSLIGGNKADSMDFDTEFLDYIMAVKVVGDVREAVKHIAAHSTHHSDAILTEDKQNATFFTTAVDSAAVYVNASTRFTDGGEFGLGCEIGISTQKMHARGPMGLRELTTYKYVVRGNGQVR